MRALDGTREVHAGAQGRSPHLQPDQSTQLMMMVVAARQKKDARRICMSCTDCDLKQLHCDQSEACRTRGPSERLGRLQSVMVSMWREQGRRHGGAWGEPCEREALFSSQDHSVFGLPSAIVSKNPRTLRKRPGTLRSPHRELCNGVSLAL